MAWKERGQPGLALSLLFDWVLFPHIGRHTIVWGQMDEDDRRIARLLLSDGIVELARQVAPIIHRRLLYLLFERLYRDQVRQRTNALAHLNGPHAA